MTSALRFLTVSALAFGFAVSVNWRTSQERHLDREVSAGFLLDTTVAKIASIGHGPFLSTFVWVDGIFRFVDAQLDGTSDNGRESRIQLVIALDPMWKIPYEFAGLTLEDESGQPTPAAIEILRRGVERFPLDWRMRIQLSFGYQLLGDTTAAAMTLAPLSRMSDSIPAYVRELGVSLTLASQGSRGAIQSTLIGLQVVEDPIGRLAYVHKLAFLLDKLGVQNSLDSARGLDLALQRADAREINRYTSWIDELTAPESGSSRSP